MRADSARVVASLERERQERTQRASGIGYGLTAEQFAARWTVAEAVAQDWLDEFVRRGFAVCVGSRYLPTSRALSLSLLADEDAA